MNPALSCRYSTINPAELMEKVIPQYCIDSPLECRFWERGANDTYQVRCADACYFLRVYRCGAFPREANEFEAEVLNYLHQQDFPVAYPIALKSGGYITEVLAPEGPRFVLLTTQAPGTEPDYDSMDTCRIVGESVAQLHTACSGFETRRRRTDLDLQGLVENSMDDMRVFMAHRPDALRVVEQIAREVRTTVQAAPKESLDIGVCHGDLHGGNLHIHEGKAIHFDFEECAVGYRVYDLATLKWGTCLGADEQGTSRWTAICAGYESVRPMSRAEHSLIDTFVIIRELAETAYGIRHVYYFGYNGIMAYDIDRVCERLEKLRKIANS